MRSDARRNQEQLLAAARELVAERGPNVPLDEVAKRAGVGIGTLYRRFPTKESLLTALVRERFQQFTVIATEVEQTVEPAEALFEMMRRHAEAVVDDAAFQLAMMNLESFQWEGIEEDKTVLHTVVARVIERGKAAGAVRPDLRAEDYGMLMCSTTAAMYFMPDKSGWRRQQEIVLAGLRPD